MKNPNNAARTPAGMEIGSGEKDKRGRSRSASKDKTSGKAERHRSESRESRGKSSSNNRSRSKSNSNNVRSSRGKSVTAITRTASNPALMASSHRLEASGRRRRGSQSHTMSRQTLNHVHDSGGDPHTPTNRPLAIMPAPTTEIVTAAPTSSSNRRASSRFETRALEFTSKVMDTTPGMTPHTSHHHHPVPSSAPAATAPYGQNHGALVPHTVNAHRSSPAGTTGNYNYGPPTIPHLDEHHQTHPKSDVPNNIKLGASSTDFGESDPIITIQLGDDGKMPPPPPRTVDELERHQERLEMRRAHIRRNLKQNNSERRLGQVERGRREGKSDNKKESKERSASRNRTAAVGSNALVVRGRRGDRGEQDEKERRHSHSVSDKKRSGVRHTRSGSNNLPSPAALALLDGSRPKPERGASRRDRSGESKSTNHPSPAALALLEGNTFKKSSDRRHSIRTKEQSKKVLLQLCDTPHDDDDDSDTSSISYGSAKRYATSGDPRIMQGVQLPRPSTDRGPPATVSMDRSRSKSRSRVVVKDDPPPSSNRGASGAVSAQEKKTRGVSKGASRRAMSREPTSRAMVTSSRRTLTDEKKEKRVSVKESTKPRRSSSRPNRNHEEESNKISNPALSASAARASRRGSQSKNGTSVRKSDQQQGRSRSRSRKSLVEPASSQSVGGPSRSGGKQQRSRSMSKPRNNGAHQSTGHVSKGGQSRLTSSTHPESLSGDEIARKNSREEDHVSTRMVEEEEEPEPMIIYKPRAHRQNEEALYVDDDTTQYEKPMTLIKCPSSHMEDKSHASSISSSSSIVESFCSDDEDDDDEEGKQKVKVRAKSALNSAKGGAKVLATKSRGALGGLKGTSRKWQSALFM